MRTVRRWMGTVRMLPLLQTGDWGLIWVGFQLAESLAQQIPGQQIQQNILGT